MKKLLSLFLAMVLALSLAIPAFGYEDLTPPLWQQWGYDSLEDYLSCACGDEDDYAQAVEEERAFLTWAETYKAAHAAEAAAFDPEAFFTEQYSAYWTKEEYMQAFELETEEEFQADLMRDWLYNIYYTEKTAVERQAFLDAYEAAHPGELAQFDADAWFERHTSNWWYGDKDQYLQMNGMDEEAFRLAMLDEYISYLQVRQATKDSVAELAPGFEAQIAAFDAEAWFQSQYAYPVGYYSSKEEYMQNTGLDTDEDFRDDMLVGYLQSLVAAKERQGRVAAYQAEHPTEVAAFDPVSYLTTHYYEYKDPKQSFMNDKGLSSDEDFFNYLFCSYLDTQQDKQDRQTWLDEFEASHPGTIAKFDADAWFAQGYYYLTKEEYMREFNLATEDDFKAAMLENYISELQWKEEEKAQYDANKLEMGGVPGELGVMLNGTYLTFPEGRAPYSNARAIYADAETLATAFGIEVPAPIDGYVPIRSVAEKAGCTVLWDENYQTVVVLDQKDLAAQLDENFTVLNGLLDKWKIDILKNYLSSGTIKVKATLLDSLDGDKTGTMTMDYSILQSALGLQMSGKYDLTGLNTLMASDEYPVDAESQTAMKGDYEVRADSENGLMYIKAAFLDQLYQSFGESYVPGAWHKTSMGATAALSPSMLTVGGYLCNQTILTSYYTDPVYLYGTALSTGQEAAKIIGDDRFEKSGSNYTLTLDRDGLAELMGYGEDYGYGYYDLPEKFDLTLTVGSSGTLTGKLIFQPYSYSSYYSPATRITADFTLSLPSQKLTMEIHGKNSYKVVVTMSGTTNTTTKTPAIAPPDGATVVEE